MKILVKVRNFFAHYSRVQFAGDVVWTYVFCLSLHNLGHKPNIWESFGIVFLASSAEKLAKWLVGYFIKSHSNA